jgi:multidrug efflux pump subunit AcrA (membrane-fusion protein)
MSPTPLSPVLALAVLLTLAGCGEAPPEAQPAPTALPRPVLTLNVKTGRILIPQLALIERGGITGVFVLEGDTLARFRMVRVGKAYGGQAEILAGLTGTETLVLGALGDVRDGSVITRR